jgi:hypothetical protein
MYNNEERLVIKPPLVMPSSLQQLNETSIAIWGLFSDGEAHGGYVSFASNLDSIG